MREVDRRSKIDRRNFLRTAAAVPPAAAVKKNDYIFLTTIDYKY